MEHTETIQPLIEDHEGPQKHKFARALKDNGKIIVGLQQKLDEQLGFVSEIGKSHLADNQFFTNKKYDELDVVCFDQD